MQQLILEGGVGILVLAEDADLLRVAYVELDGDGNSGTSGVDQFYGLGSWYGEGDAAVNH